MGYGRTSHVWDRARIIVVSENRTSTKFLDNALKNRIRLPRTSYNNNKSQHQKVRREVDE